MQKEEGDLPRVSLRGGIKRTTKKKKRRWIVYLHGKHDDGQRRVRMYRFI